MALSLDDFATASKPKRLPCSFERIVAALDKIDRNTLEAALKDPSLTHTGIAAVLSANGHVVKASTVSRHRKGECGCAG